MTGTREEDLATLAACGGIGGMIQAEILMLRWDGGRETDPCPDGCGHWRAHHGTYGCSACSCKRWVL